MNPTRLVGRVRTCALAALSLLLPGCPLSDKYFIESDSIQNVGGFKGVGDTSVLAASGGSMAGTTSSGGASTAGSSPVATCIASQCSGTCCNGTCVDDLTNSPSNCGSCSTPCAVGQACVSSVCTSGWSTMAPPPAGFVAREMAAYVGFGDRLFVFGGQDVNGINLGDGAIYNALTNRWTMVSIDANAPSPRRLGTAVWTGSVILVYGGRVDVAGVSFSDGAAYNPATEKWSAITKSSTGRVGPIGAANSSQAVFWGGWGTSNIFLGGAERSDLTTSVWQAPTVADPGIIDNTAYAFTGQYLLSFGGRLGGTTKTNGATSYDLISNSWIGVPAVTGASVVSARWGAFGVWDGSTFTVWGGRDETSAKNNGQYNSVGNWTEIPYQAGAAPTARWAPARQTGWAFARKTGDLLFIGGQDFNGVCLGDGARYVFGSGTTSGSWTPIPRWNATDDHQWGAAAYIGGALVVWGGRTGTGLASNGDRWAP